MLVYIVRGYKEPGLSPSQHVEHVRALEREYRDVLGLSGEEEPFEVIIADTNGAGKVFCQELLVRTGLYATPAKKTEKIAFIGHMNGDLRTGVLKVVERDAIPLIEEWELLPWKDERQLTYEDRKHEDHLADAALYGWRNLRGYDATNRLRETEPGTSQWYNEQADLEERRAAEEEERRAKGEDEWDWGEEDASMEGWL